MKSNRGNRSAGRESLDKPFQRRRRNLGQRNADGATRADYVAFRLAEAGTLRELCHIAIRLGVPARYVDKVLARDFRNSVKVMALHRAARHFYEKKRREREERRRGRMATGRTCGRAGKLGITGRTSPGTLYGIPEKAERKKT